MLARIGLSLLMFIVCWFAGWGGVTLINISLSLGLFFAIPVFTLGFVLLILACLAFFGIFGAFLYEN